MDVQPSATVLLPRPSASPAVLEPALAEPLLSVVIVNYWRWDDTVRVVRQLRRDPALKRGDAEVVIVDNHSPPHPSVPRLRRTSGVSLRRWNSNRGFARAVNEGCRLSRGEWLLLLNPDTSVPSGFLGQALLKAEQLAEQQPDTGIVGFRLKNSDGTPQFSTGRFPGLAGTLVRLLLPRNRRKYTPAPASARVDWATGCCLMVRRDCWNQLGGFDRDFFLYYEDVDLCRRARRLGWSVVYDPELFVVHHRPLHLREVPAHLRLVTRHALLTYAGKHWPAWQSALLGGIIRLESFIRRRLLDWRGDREGAETFATLGEIVGDVRGGRSGKARARLLRVIRQQEERRAAELPGRRGTVTGEAPPESRPLHRGSLLPAGRSVGLVPRQHPPARAAG